MSQSYPILHAFYAPRFAGKGVSSLDVGMVHAVPIHLIHTINRVKPFRDKVLGVYHTGKISPGV